MPKQTLNAESEEFVPSNNNKKQKKNLGTAKNKKKEKIPEENVAFIMKDIVAFNTIDGIITDERAVKIYHNVTPELRSQLQLDKSYERVDITTVQDKYCSRCGTVFDLRNVTDDLQSIVDSQQHCSFGKCCDQMQLIVPEPKPEEINTVIYHGGCADGNGSLWAVHRSFCKTRGHQTALSDVNSFADFHEKAMETTRLTDILSLCKDNNVLIADFSYPPHIITKIKMVCSKMILLDHHDTGVEMLAEEPNCYFDMNHSAAYMVWYFMRTGRPLQTQPFNEQVPALIRYIQDRDLWNWKEPNSREINCGLFHKGGGKLEYYDSFHDNERETMEELKQYGAQYLAFQSDLLDKEINSKAYIVKFFGYDAVAANISVVPSETCEKMLEKFKQCRIAIVYYDNKKNGVHKFSARRRENDTEIKLSAMCEFKNSGVGWGGGGHPASAGFTIPIHLSVEFFFHVFGNSKMLIR